MILIISTCDHKFHELEFVKPIEDILRNNKTKFITFHYKNLNKNKIQKAEKIIICGTSLQDNQIVADLNYFKFLKTTNKPVLGICAGMQLIGLINNAGLKSKIEIGLIPEEFKKPFLGLKGKKPVYHIHRKYVEFQKLKDFEIYTTTKIPEAVKHKTKPIYGVLFHPEVRNKQVITNFLNQ